MVPPRLLRSPDVVSIQQLIVAGIAPTQARMFVEPLNAAFARFHVTDPVNIAHFIAQTRHESHGFTKLEEDLYYRDPVRMVKEIFRGPFDLDGDRQVDPEEIEFAKNYVRNPEGLANRVYANRLGNGNEDSGDGWKYRGGGLIQLTGRDNYTAAAAECGVDYVTHPELVREPTGAAMTGVWFWAKNGLANFGHQLTVEAATRKVNGPRLLGLNERREFFHTALDAMTA